MAVWPGLVGSVRAHGRRCMVGLASAWVAWCSKRTARLRPPVGCQCALDLVVLCVAPGRARICRDTPAVGAHRCNHRLVLAGQQACSVVAHSLSLVGFVRVGAHALCMAAQPGAAGVSTERMRSSPSFQRQSTVPDSTSSLTLTAQFERFSAGRARDGDALSLVLPPGTVAHLAEACAAARSTASNLPLVAGTEAILDLIELMHALLGGFSKVVAADALSLRSTETLEQALSGLEKLRAELDQRQ
jgi:hypothetical protein